MGGYIVGGLQSRFGWVMETHGHTGWHHERLPIATKRTYTVAQLLPDGQALVPVVGNMLGINVGESVELAAPGPHSQYGRQFKAEQVRQ
jgi:hypothetical protein